MPAAAVLLAVAAAIIDAWECTRYSQDFRDFVSGGARFIANSNLYEGSGAYNGFIGPPFQALFHVPVASIFAIKPAAALAIWTAINFIALVGGIRVWARLLSIPAASPASLAAVLVVAFPIYREFQAQNLTILLLLFGGLSARALLAARDGEAGAWIGLSAALKLYPGMPLAYFAARGRWRMAVAGGATFVGLTLLPVLRTGFDRFIWLWQEWVRSRQASTWPLDYHSQSIPHVVRLWWPAEGAALAATAMFAILVAATMLLGFLRRRSPMAAAEEMAFAIVMGFIASPIGWINYWILAIPALMVVSREAARHAPARIALSVCGVFALIAPVTRDHPRGEFLVIAIVLIWMLTSRLMAPAGKPATPSVV
jgi:hypothetical protein